MPDPNALPNIIELGYRHAAATLYEAMGKRGEVGPDIRPVGPACRLSGLAFTVRCPAGDAKGLWVAIAEAPAGAVIVADTGGSPFTTAIGGTSVRAAMARGLAGFVLNGAVRDVAEIRALGLPVFAAGVSVRGTQKAHPGWIGEPVVIGLASVSAGDLVVGDDDGVVIVPRSCFDTLAGRVATQALREQEIDRRVGSGEDVRDVLGLR